MDDIEFDVEELLSSITLPVAEPTEFRLYYDESGNVRFYTCEKLEGNFVVVDSKTYAECRYDLKILDGKIIKNTDGSFVSTYKKSSEGIKTAYEDINLIVDDTYNGKTNTWKLTHYEF